MMIGGPGEYTTRSGEKVTITAVSRGWAMGFWGDSLPGDAPDTWNCATGQMWSGAQSKHDIIGPRVPTREKVKGWVNVYSPGKVVTLLFTDKLEAIYLEETDPPVEETSR